MNVELSTDDLFRIIGQQHAEIVGLRAMLQKAEKKAQAMTDANALLVQRNGAQAMTIEE